MKSLKKYGLIFIEIIKITKMNPMINIDHALVKEACRMYFYRTKSINEYEAEHPITFCQKDILMEYVVVRY